MTKNEMNPKVNFYFDKATTWQEEINKLIVHHALQNKVVVRLKGGDVSLFSNILDELQVVAANNIPYEIIPGITAATGAAAGATRGVEADPVSVIVTA